MIMLKDGLIPQQEMSEEKHFESREVTTIMESGQGESNGDVIEGVT